MMIDVGQGDSFLLHSGKYNILVDTGGVSYGDSNIASNTLIPLFKSLGIRKIDYLFLSHGDQDHLGEAVDLVNNFDVERVYFNEGELNANEKEVISSLSKDTNYFISYEGSYYEVGDFRFYSLGTDLEDENDSSLILYGFMANYSFILMGDSSVKSENVLLSKYDVFNIDILKVGHHGSKTSSGIEFINKLNPKYSLISVGKDNKFGHPNKEVLDNLIKSKIYRTDIDGAVVFKIKNNKLMIDTCNS
jgi:competence protein ComEC